MSAKITMATVWLDGCSGCHMSFLDLDERLLDLAAKADLVYSPLVDLKEFPEQVDLALIEGAVATDEDLEKIHLIRGRTKTLVSLGDCAVTGNVPALRNPFGTDAVYQRAYDEHVVGQPGRPDRELPVLLERATPVHEKVSVDLVIPGCPPSADLIWAALTELVEGRIPDVTALTRFG
jgi:NAD-reducing hydrogenase small subunit